MLNALALIYLINCLLHFIRLVQIYPPELVSPSVMFEQIDVYNAYLKFYTLKSTRRVLHCLRTLSGEKTELSQFECLIKHFPQA